MSVRRAGLVSVTGDKREEVERKVGRNKALPERKDMVGVWIGSSGPDLPAQIYKACGVCRHGRLWLFALQAPLDT